MLLQNMPREDLQKALFELEQALHNHLQWHNNLIRTLACRSAFDKHDIVPKAHKECRFGQWYYGNTTQAFVDHPGFVAIGEAHKLMHHLATRLLLNLNEEKPILPADYDHFANSLERLQLEIHALRNELESTLYNRDQLTMTINRVSMLPILREQQELCRRDFQTCSLAMIDIDHFKKVNDKYGHIIGDKVLVMVAHYLMENVRVYDKVFRYGGEEFLLCMPHLDLAQAHVMIDRLCSSISTMSFDVGLPKPLHITVSCGLALLEANSPIDDSIDAADKAMYHAKASGRNQIKLHKPSQ